MKYEVGKVLKCLQAGFAQVVVVCPNRSKLARIQKAVAAALTPAQKDLVTCRLPEGFMTSLLDWAAADPEGAVAESGKPRKQKITLGSSTLNDSERTQREKDMLERMAAAMRRNASSPA